MFLKFWECFQNSVQAIVQARYVALVWQLQLHRQYWMADWIGNCLVLLTIASHGDCNSKLDHQIRLLNLEWCLYTVHLIQFHWNTVIWCSFLSTNLAKQLKCRCLVKKGDHIRPDTLLLEYTDQICFVTSGVRPDTRQVTNFHTLSIVL